jgi:uncharacterized protein
MTSMAFTSPAWLPGGHLQTIYPALFAPRPKVKLYRERWTTPDEDFLDLDFTFDPAKSAPNSSNPNSSNPTTSNPTTNDTALGQAEEKPKGLVVLFHGLEGSSASHYAQATMQACIDQGWLGVVPNFRGCSGEENRALRSYHSGETRDIDFILRQLSQRFPNLKRFAMGVSLGGNALCKWLGEQGESASQFISAGAAFCPPQDLQEGAKALARGFNLVYMNNFLKTLKGKALVKLERFPEAMNREKIIASKNFFEFDEEVTAKVNGFASCYDYWEKCSSKKFLPQVRTPLLVVNPLNDPFLPVEALARPGQVSRSVTLYYPKHGGHVGFLQGSFPGNLSWLPNTALNFFSSGDAPSSLAVNLNRR